MKIYILGLLLLTVISVNIIGCNRREKGKLDELEKNIEQIRGELPKKGGLLDIEFDRENKRIVYIIDSDNKEIASKKDLDRMYADRYYLLYAPLLIDPQNASLIVECKFDICYRYLNKDHTQEVNATIKPYMFGDMEKLTPEQLKYGVSVEYEEGKLSPSTYVLKFNLNSYASAKYEIFVRYMLDKGVELTDDQKSYVFILLYSSNTFTAAEPTDREEFKEIYDELTKKINTIPRQEFIYPYLEAIDTEHFILKVPLEARQYMTDGDKYKTDEEFCKYIIDYYDTNKEYTDFYFGRLKNLEIQFINGDGEVFLSEKFK